ncbi:hypothetical protein [uncultured Azohydromonas sp.]|jgi:PGAP1-like protein.|uniref:esterase/lipase family protein n=1 Tax=uncultured Azohydromonas sp. TaxID=487342 RepID=UPI0026061DC2|nr:hypothetical protein [uncultured Azohydromonas sp.]
MATSSIVGYQLPVQPETGGRKAQGFVTPTNDKLPQKMGAMPRRVIPIVFLPGIMGSNLRLSAGRQHELGMNNNIAWRPDRKGEAFDLLSASPAQRQMQLDPDQTEVDTYAPDAPTGDPTESPERRHNNARVKFTLPLELGITTPLLMDDPPMARPCQTKEQKARERGWGEVFFDSYGELLQRCELRLHTAFRGGKLDEWWRNIVGVNPAAWQAHPGSNLQPLQEDELRQALRDCWFPVHAMGYNWLKSNRRSGIDTAKRINKLITQYISWGFQCEKVIVVTHSMGGLVARAMVHPGMGNLQEKILGIVHGVMPATGAGAAYKRMRCGFEDGFFNIAAKVLGNSGDEVTAVLGNSQGGLELLPSQAYGYAWLQIVRNGEILLSLPRLDGDPYEEIYKLRGAWYRLLNEEWLNPAKMLSNSNCFGRTCRMLDEAKIFHCDIENIYHPTSYAHYGADASHAAWHRVVWDVNTNISVGSRAETFQLLSDGGRGWLQVFDPALPKPLGLTALGPSVRLQPPADPGDQTVPVHSADDQLLSGKFKGLFRQTGYEHQDSYKNEAVLHSTLYSLVRIIQTMNWSK